MIRILLTGGVGTGKTTLSGELSALTGAPVLSTDDALWRPEVVASPDPWRAANDEVARWIMRPGPWIIEGTRVPHALALIMRSVGREAPLPFDPPMIYLERALHYERRDQAPMTASTLAAARHCERRLGIAVQWARYEPGLAAAIMRTLEQRRHPADQREGE